MACLLLWLASLVLEHVFSVRETLRHEQAMNEAAEEKARGEAEAVWAEAQAKMPVLIAPPADDDDAAINRQRWARDLPLFLAAGNKLGFSSRAMCPRVLLPDDWLQLTHYLQAERIKVLVKDKNKSVGNVWAEGMDLETALDKFANGALPYPTYPVPPIHWAVNTPREKRGQTLET